MKKHYYLTLLLLVIFSITTAQETTTNTEKPTDKLGFMLGTWEGNSWMMTRDGRVASNIKEHIYCKTDCNIMIAEGLGTKTDPDTKETTVVHDAFGVMFIDPDTKKLMLRAYKDNKISVSEIELLQDKVIRWGMTIPNQGTIRFTSDYSQENKWIEVGEFSRDGETWMQFLGMELTRIGD